MAKFEQLVMAEVARLRERLRADETVSGFTFSIHASGRLDGDILVFFELADSYGCGVCRGGDLQTVLEEYLRRRNWSARHAPLCLPNTEEEGGETT